MSKNIPRKSQTNAAHTQVYNVIIICYYYYFTTYRTHTHIWHRRRRDKIVIIIIIKMNSRICEPVRIRIAVSTRLARRRSRSDVVSIKIIIIYYVDDGTKRAVILFSAPLTRPPDYENNLKSLSLSLGVHLRVCVCLSRFVLCWFLPPARAIIRSPARWRGGEHLPFPYLILSYIIRSTTGSVCCQSYTLVSILFILHYYK